MIVPKIEMLFIIPDGTGSLIWIPVSKSRLRNGNVFRFFSGEVHSESYIVKGTPLFVGTDWVIPNEPFSLEMM